jgi:hypothetical protein
MANEDTDIDGWRTPLDSRNVGRHIDRIIVRQRCEQAERVRKPREPRRRSRRETDPAQPHNHGCDPLRNFTGHCWIIEHKAIIMGVRVNEAWGND